MADPAIKVQGLRELERAFRKTDKEEAKLLRKSLKETALPVKRAAEGKALAKIRNMGRSRKWATMRLGVSKSVVYMVPRQKGTHGRGPLRRPNLKDLLLDRAMIPALEEHEGEVIRGVERVLDTAGARWEKT